MHIDNRVTVAQFKSILADMCKVWLPKLEASAFGDVFFCEHSKTNWETAFSETELEDEIESIITRDSFAINSPTLVVEQDFLEWCGNQPCNFSIGDSACSRLDLVYIRKFPSNVFFKFSGNVLLLTECDLTTIPNQRIFDIRVSNIYLLKCVLSNDFMKQVHECRKVFSIQWCTNWKDIKCDINPKELIIKFDDRTQLPDGASQLPPVLNVCAIISLMPNGSTVTGVLPSSFLKDLLSTTAMSNLTIRGQLDSDFSPLMFFFVQNLKKITRLPGTEQEDVLLKTAVDLVINTLNGAAGTKNKTELLLQCQEQLTEMGLGKYAKL